MRSNRQSKTERIPLQKTAAKKIKRDPVDHRTKPQSSDAILADLKHRLAEIYDLNATGSVLTWDEATYMPNGGAVARGRQIAMLRRLAHERFADPTLGRLLDRMDRYSVGLLTPGGTIPAYLSSEVRNFLSAPAAQRIPTAAHVVEQVAPRHIEVIHDQPHMARWLWPLLGALAVLGLGSYLFSANNRAPVAPPVVQTAPTPPPPAVPMAPPRLALTNDDGVIHYSGSVHDEETRTAVINALKAVFGADKIKGDIGVDLNRGAAPWLVNLRNTLENLKVPGLQAVFDGNSINLGGILSEADRDRISNSLRNVLGSGVVIGTLADKMTDLVANSNAKVTSALASLKSGFDAKDLTGILNQSIINFPNGGSEVPAATVSLLQNAAAQIKELKPGTVLEIAGYTDNVGDPAANVTLSQQRADAVRNVLIHAGVDPSMLVAKGYGSANPVASNDLLEGRYRNRRIEYRVLKS